MKKQIILTTLLILGVLVGSIATGVLAQGSGITTREQSDVGILPMPSPEPPIVKLPKADDGKLYVTGEASMSFDPDQAELYLGVFAESYSAKSAQDEVRTKMDSVRKALKNKGVSDSQIEMMHYDVSPQYSWDGNKRTLKGYRVMHNFKVKTLDVNNVGTLIDAAIEAGANDVNGVQFTLQDATRAELRINVLQTAAKNAQGKAKALASGFDLELGAPLEITEGVNYIPQPMRYYASGSGAGFAESAPATEISPGAVKVTARVSVTYGYEA